jgi:LPXTG-motif cell wall-anchored protein
MRVNSRSVLRALVIGLVLALAVPAIALGQTQGGTSGDGDGSQSGDVANSQSNAQSASGSGNQQNATNQNCVAGRDCVNNNITNQNQGGTVGARRFERTYGVRNRRHYVRRVRLAYTGSDLTMLFIVGGLVTAGGIGVLAMRRRGFDS